MADIDTASIRVPTMGGVQKSIMNYGVGIGAGLLYNVIASFTGSGLIGGALSASITGAAVKGIAGEMVAVNAGFAVGQSGLGALGLGDVFGFLKPTAPAADSGPDMNVI